MTEFYGSSVVITGQVQYVGEGEDPSTNPWMIAYAKALKQVYQPERLNPEDASNGVCDSLISMETQRERSEEVAPLDAIFRHFNSDAKLRQVTKVTARQLMLQHFRLSTVRYLTSESWPLPKRLQLEKHLRTAPMFITIPLQVNKRSLT